MDRRIFVNYSSIRKSAAMDNPHVQGVFGCEQSSHRFANLPFEKILRCFTCETSKENFLSFPISSSNDLSDCEERGKSREREKGDTQRVKENVCHLLLAFLVSWQFSGALMWSTIPEENETTCRVLASPASVVVALATSFLGEERSLGTRLSVSIDHSSLFVTPKFCIRIVFSFSWELKCAQEKLKTMLMQTFGVINKSIIVCYGISGEFNSHS